MEIRQYLVISILIISYVFSQAAKPTVAIPDAFALHQNYPNPFNPTTQINYDIPEDGFAEMIIYDLMGREVKTLVKRSLSTGYYTQTWNGKNNRGQLVGAGLYFCQMRAKGFTKTVKMLLLK